MRNLTVGLFNDSFPPTIDGVANVVFNYAQVIQKKYGRAIVATPHYPGVMDAYPFEVVRYPSARLSRKLEYRVGYPFGHTAITKLAEKQIDIIHTHCPFSAALLARLLRHRTGAPIVLTYHTKFDIDIEKRIAYNPIRKASIRFLLANIQACDEVWVVSLGAGENLKALGYTGDYRIMPNGTDFPVGKSPRGDMDSLAEKYNLPKNVPRFLYVGRMMWYKGIRLTVDALRIAKDQGADFRMLFVGEGSDREEIEAYVESCGLKERCLFTGAIHDRQELKVHFSIADLFLFPSTYDTNGIVVREAAACSCPSLLIAGSCSSEEIIHGVTGILAAENKDAIAAEILRACKDLKRLQQIGAQAADSIYLSWDDAVEKAYHQYEVILDRHTRDNTMSTRRMLPLRNRHIQGKIRVLKRSIDRLFDWLG